MKTTCLINNYNYAQYVSEAIDGALGQTEPFDEIIVVDDGSTDGSLELLQSTYERYQNVQIVGKANEGQLSCLNEGFARSTGDIVFFLDADDVYEPNYVAQALEAYRRDRYCDFLFCGRRLFGQQAGLSLPFPQDRDLGYSVIRTSYTQDWIGAPTSCLSIRSHVLEKILPLPFVDEWRVRADDCLVFGASLAGARKRYLAQPLVRYRVHGKNHLHGSKPDQGETYRRRLAINRLFEYLQRGLCCDILRLADFTHREFRTIEKPTFGQLRNYARVSIGARVPWTRRLSCIADMFAHYLGAKWSGASQRQSETHSSPSDHDILRFPSAESEGSAARENAECAADHGRRAA